ncbi:MAG: TetR family transcriptional regulator [Streptosporangiales bacterium]|nr:TetR family transcriptional regulator [Streptosporangiales bacterium]
MSKSTLGTAKARREQYGQGGTERGRRTRALLLAAARTVFERDGYLDARVADIVTAAGVSHGTFYTYFDSKLQVFRGVIAEVSAEIQDAVTVPLGERGDRDPSDFVRRLDLSNRRFLDVYRKNHRMLMLMEQMATIDPEVGERRVLGRRRHIERIAASIRRLQREGLVPRDLDPRVAAGALTSMVANFAYHWLAMGEAFDEELAKSTLTRMWLGAIGYTPARS